MSPGGGCALPGLLFGFVAPVSAAPPGKTGAQKPDNGVDLVFFREVMVVGEG